MAIRIVATGNSAAKIAPLFDECRIESVINDPNGEDVEKLSFAVDVLNGNPMYKRIRSDDETSEFIAELHEHGEIGSIRIDEENRDIIIILRELGQEELEIGEFPE
jgi:hypothetical protein